MARDNDKVFEQQINFSLFMLSIAFLVFTFIITVNASLLNNTALVLQLVISIPCLTASVFGKIKLLKNHYESWRTFSYIYWIIGYTFLINSVAILLDMLVSQTVGIVFLAGNVAIALTYSWVGIGEDWNRLGTRLWKDAFFTALLVVFGLLPILGAF